MLHRAKTKHLAARALREWSIAEFRVCGRSKESAAKSSFVAIRSAETISWHPSNSYSPAMQAKEAFHTETPNPSIERTRSGSAGLALISFWAKPALPPRAAHVKR